MKRLVCGAVALASLLAGAVEVATEAELATALENATAGDEIVITADIAPTAGFTATVPVTIRGVKQDGTPVVINGEPNNAEILLTLSSTDSTAGYLIENIVFTNAVTRGVAKTGGASATFKSCVFTANGRMADANGRGGNFAGYQPASILRFEKCLFLNNEDGFSDGRQCSSSGLGAYISAFKRVEIVDTDFIGNGVLRTKHDWVVGREQGLGAAIYANSAPIVAKNVRFIGNRAVGHSSKGGIVYLSGNGDGTAFTNCLWVGNTHVPFTDGSNGESGGAVCLEFDNATRIATFSNCTVAYNIAPGARTPGLNIRSGKAVVRNSIFFGNLMSGKCGLASEIAVRTTDSVLDIDYSLLPSSEAPYLYIPEGLKGNAVFGKAMRYGDPQFATTPEAFFALVKNVSEPSFPTTLANVWNFWFDDDLDLTTIDTHVRSLAGRWDGSGWVTDEGVDSLALDAADPEADFSNEPEPNGGVANLGFYGNTAEASKSAAGLATLSVADVGVSFGADYTRPTFTVTLGESSHYYVDIFLCLGTVRPDGDGTDGWEFVHHISSAAEPGHTYTFSDAAYFEAGATLYWRVCVGSLTQNVSRDGSVVVSGEMPPAWGRGGGAEVIHLDGAAKGDGSGRDWLNACTSLDAALAHVTETRTNLWVCGSVFAESVAPTVARAVTVRGGFAGVEDAPEDRDDSTPNGVIDGAVIYDGLHFTHASGAALVERMTFQNTSSHGIYKSGNGDLAVRNCRFDSCGCVASIATNGRGIYATGNQNVSSLEVSDCVFENVVSLNGNSQSQARGVAFYISGFKAASVVRTRVVRCGIPWTTGAAAVPGRDNSHGMVAYVANAPVTLADCAFVGNRTTQHTFSNAFFFEGNCDGATVRNCVFAGNLGIPYVGGGGSAKNGNGLFRISMDNAARTVTFENCTFAYNLVEYDGCAGISVAKGAVRVRNSLFHGNIAKSETALGVDLYVGGGTLDVDWCAFDAVEFPYIGTAADNLTLGEHIVTGDPLLVTPWSEVADQIAGGTVTPPLTAGNRSYFKENYDPTTIDVHLRSKGGRWDRAAGAWRRDRETSPCIGAGDPATPLGAQTAGKAVNIGAYGGTAEASQPYRAALVLVVR